MLQLEITIEMLWPFGPPLGELRDEWDRTPVESIAKIHGTKKQSKKWVARHFSITRLTKQVELFPTNPPLRTNQFERQAAEEKGRQEGAGKKRLTYSYMGIYVKRMARAATTSDAFNAVAEPRRRDILNYLAMQERSVSEIVDAMEVEQPSVSKHLKVLKGVGLVEVRREGRQMLYKVNAMAIRPLHAWTSTFERLWKHQLLRIKTRAEANDAPKQ
jgi:DNA-binding transcriptional ArsR family regulator